MPRQPSKRPLPRAFYLGETARVARALLGKVLWHRSAAGLAGGRIVEVEAYLGEEDPASHAARGPRGRAAVMFAAGGRAYVYVSYGMHHCMNVVTGPQGRGGAVLLRALEPVAGLELMRARRGRDDARELASGPGKLAQALGIGKAENELDLCAPPLWLSEGAPPAAIETTPRIGISKAVDWPLRFVEKGSRYASR